MDFVEGLVEVVHVAEVLKGVFVGFSHEIMAYQQVHHISEVDRFMDVPAIQDGLGQHAPSLDSLGSHGAAELLAADVATLAFGWAFCVHSGTGAIFGYGARVLYESPLLPAAFVAAAMASGTALMILVIVALFKLTKRHVDDELVLWLGKLLAVCLLVVVYFLFTENAYRAYVVELREAALYYLFGGYHSVQHPGVSHGATDVVLQLSRGEAISGTLVDPDGGIVAKAYLGGLHHRYTRAA